ncbi:MAG: hypothetical protein U5K79_05940 [Cyclobacteriaceae bacterium]|nr:hypothetical protein [Cyclobacteriaceae bacterium]
MFIPFVTSQKYKQQIPLKATTRNKMTELERLGIDVKEEMEREVKKWV